MQTPEPVPPIELQLLRANNDGDWRGRRFAAVGSVAVHVVLIVAAAGYSEPAYTPKPERMLVRHVTPLYIPPDLTQKAPNKVPVTKELVAEAIAPRPQLKAPAPSPAAHKAQPPAPKALPAPPPPPPPQQVAKALPKPPEIEPPPTQPAPAIKAQTLPPAPVAPPARTEQPKLALEDVDRRERAAGTGRSLGVTLPSNSIQEAVRNLSSGSAQLGQSVGDLGADIGGLGPGLNLPSSAGRPRSNLELKSDPMGVDFRPYMLQVLAAVRRNWFAVYPEAARLGQRGQVVLQFAIAKQGLVTKVIFAGQSNAKALDQSAVAAISASNPLPPLPPEFKGDRIVLQMTFLYNMPR